MIYKIIWHHVPIPIHLHHVTILIHLHHAPLITLMDPYFVTSVIHWPSELEILIPFFPFQVRDVQQVWVLDWILDFILECILKVAVREFWKGYLSITKVFPIFFFDVFIISVITVGLFNHYLKLLYCCSLYY